jgi:hypothetical protein
MINDEPSIKEMAALWKCVHGYLEKIKVSCPEACCEDRVYEEAPNLVADMSEIVGFYEYPDE